MKFKIPLLIQSYFSPFKHPKMKFYFGKTAIGLPYFLPRKFVKATPKKAIEEALKEIKRVKEHNTKEGSFKLTEHSFQMLYDRYITSSFAETKKVSVDFRDVFWKIKWTSTDYRFEHNSRFSVVFFGYQFAIIFVAPEEHHYWSCFLFYSRDTKGSWRERVKKCREEFPQTWIRHSGDKEEKIDMYDVVLKEKYT